MTPRRALVLIRQLPLGSATIAAMRGGPEFRGWDLDRYLMANLIDAVNMHTYAFIASNTAKNSPKPKPPEPTARPELAAKRRADPNSFANIAKRKIAAQRAKKQEAASVSEPGG